ncbi:hypothetical protein LINPERHAP1_LOCUS35484 [Linum perenne]
MNCPEPSNDSSFACSAITVRSSASEIPSLQKSPPRRLQYARGMSLSFHIKVYCDSMTRFEKRRKDRERLKQEKRKKKKEKRNNNNSRSNSDGKSLPRFGEWDESDPSAADGYSAIFDIVRKEKNSSSHGLCAGNLTFKLTDQIKTRRRSRLKRFIKSLKPKITSSVPLISAEVVELLVKVCRLVLFQA